MNENGTMRERERGERNLKVVDGGDKYSGSGASCGTGSVACLKGGLGVNLV